MKTFKIPVVWESFGVLDVEATSLEEAIKMVREDKDVNGKEFGLPLDSDYVDGTFRLRYEDDEIEEYELFN